MMWFKKTPLPSFELRFNLPPDGTYPPRIFSFENSIWLQGEASIRLTGNVTIRRTRKGCLLYSHSKNGTVLVNGREIFGEHVLQDGDYISTGRLKGFFQLDPVANFRKHIERNIEAFPQPVSITPTRSLQKWLVIDAQGISLDGGQHAANWDEIVYIEFGHDQRRLFKWWVNLFVLDERGNRKKLPAKLNRINHKEFTDARLWITNSAPFRLSLIVDNTAKHGTLLPLFVWIGLMLVLSAFFSRPTGLNQESIERFFSTSLAFTGHMVVSGLIGLFIGWTIFFAIPSLVKRILKPIIKARKPIKNSNGVD
jgi:hypothetical protein